MSAVLEYPQRYRVDVREYLRMAEAGVFGPEKRLELIEGEIIEMAPIGSPHAGVVNRLNRLMNRLAGSKALVAIQNPLIVGKRSVPQPDLALLKPRTDDYGASHPTAEDVMVVIEVADSSLRKDRLLKGPLYAMSGFSEYWIVNVPEQVVEVHRGPTPQGWERISRHGRDEQVTVEAFPDLKLAIASFLG